MSIFLIEIKNEYTSRLVNLLAPLIYNVINYIYIDATKVSHENDVLKVFQTCLKAIPHWNDTIKDRETTRILKESNSVEWLEDLIKATIKSYIQLLTYNPGSKQSSTFDDYKNITTQEFIHTAYIETARQLWNNPYLLFHKCPPIEQKRNQRDCLGLIKECIIEALRKLLPYNQILKMYLCSNNNVNDLQVDNNMTEQDINNIKTMCKADLNKFSDTSIDTPQQPLPNKPEQLNESNQLTNIDTDQQTKQLGGFDTPKGNDSETVRGKILNIINGGSNNIENKYKIDDKIKEALHILSTNTTIGDSETSLMSENILDVFINTTHNKSKNSNYLKF